MPSVPDDIYRNSQLAYFEDRALLFERECKVQGEYIARLEDTLLRLLEAMECDSISENIRREVELHAKS